MFLSDCLLSMLQAKIIPLAPLQQVWVIFRNLSCPAVSQICNFTLVSPMLTVFNLKSTPMVATQLSLNTPSQNLVKRFVLPTPLSPIIITLARNSCSFVFVVIPIEYSFLLLIIYKLIQQLNISNSQITWITEILYKKNQKQLYPQQILILIHQMMTYDLFSYEVILQNNKKLYINLILPFLLWGRQQKYSADLNPISSTNYKHNALQNKLLTSLGLQQPLGYRSAECPKTEIIYYQHHYLPHHPLENNNKAAKTIPKDYLMDFIQQQQFKGAFAWCDFRRISEMLQQDNIIILELQGMFTMEKNKQQLYLSDQEDNQMFQSQHQQPFQSENITQSLTNARNKFIDFVQHLGDIRLTQIRSDVMTHCEQINKNRKIISMFNSHQTILKLITSRIDKMIKNKKIKKNWSQEDIKILVWIVSKYSDQHGIYNLQKQLSYEDWKNISSLIPGVSQNSCMYKWLSLRKVNLSSKNWLQEESKLLNAIIHESFSIQLGSYVLTGSNWRQISEKLYQQNKHKNKVFRSPKQCKEHWNCFLNPKLKKGPWQTQEDILLLTLIQKNKGLKKWSEIVQSFSGRTENALKNRYNLLLEKQKRINKSNKNEMSLILDYLQNFNSKNQINSDQQINQPISNIAEVKIQVIQRKNSYENNEFYQQADISQNKKSQSNDVESPSSSTTAHQLNISGISTKIHFLSSNERQEFLSWIKERTDVKKCCLKNGSFQISQ